MKLPHPIGDGAGKEGLRPSVGVDLALVLDHLGRPVVGDAVLNLGLGEALGQFVRHFSVQLGDGHRGIGQGVQHDVLRQLVLSGVLSLLLSSLVQLGGQLVPNRFGFGSVDGGDEGQDGVHGDFLHGKTLSGL